MRKLLLTFMAALGFLTANADNVITVETPDMDGSSKGEITIKMSLDAEDYYICQFHIYVPKGIDFPDKTLKRFSAGDMLGECEVEYTWQKENGAYGEVEGYDCYYFRVKGLGDEDLFATNGELVTISYKECTFTPKTVFVTDVTLTTYSKQTYKVNGTDPFPTADPIVAGKWYKIHFPQEAYFTEAGWSKDNAKAIYEKFDDDQDEPAGEGANDVLVAPALFGKYLAAGKADYKYDENNALIRHQSEAEGGGAYDYFPAIQCPKLSEEPIEGRNVIFTDGCEDDALLFRFVDASDGMYYLQNKQTGLYLRVAGNSGVVTLSATPSKFSTTYLGWGATVLNCYNIDGTKYSALYGNTANNLLETNPATPAIGSNFMLCLEGMDNDDPNEPINSLQLKMWPGKLYAYTFACDVTLESTDLLDIYTDAGFKVVTGAESYNQITLDKTKFTGNTLKAGVPYIIREHIDDTYQSWETVYNTLCEQQGATSPAERKAVADGMESMYFPVNATHANTFVNKPGSNGILHGTFSEVSNLVAATVQENAFQEAAKCGIFSAYVDITGWKSTDALVWEEGTVVSEPTVSLAADKTTAVQGSEITLTATPSDFENTPTITYEVAKDGGDYVALETNVYTPMETGEFTFKATAKDGETTKTATVTVTVTAFTPNFKPGDADFNQNVTVNDYNTVKNYILNDNAPTNKYTDAFYTANANEDEKIDASDLTIIVDKIYADAADKAKLNVESAMCDVEGLNLVADGNQLVISADNANGFIAAQMDIQLPAGVQITSAKSAGHIVSFNKLANGKTRVLIAGLGNNTFSEDVATITLSSEAQSASTGNVIFTNTARQSVKAVAGTVTGIADAQSVKCNVESVKVLDNGKVVIKKNGKTYNVKGQLVR